MENMMEAMTKQELAFLKAAVIFWDYHPALTPLPPEVQAALNEVDGPVLDDAGKIVLRMKLNRLLDRQP